MNTVKGDEVLYYKHDGNLLRGIFLTHVDDFFIAVADKYLDKLAKEYLEKLERV